MSQEGLTEERERGRERERQRERQRGREAERQRERERERVFCAAEREIVAKFIGTPSVRAFATFRRSSLTKSDYSARLRIALKRSFPELRHVHRLE
jgi:hypothetical protein